MGSMTTPAEFTPRQRLWAPGELLLAGAIIVGANIYDVVPVSETPWLVLLGLAVAPAGAGSRGGHSASSGP